jgi:hypothetical protein
VGTFVHFVHFVPSADALAVTTDTEQERDVIGIGRVVFAA